MHAVFFSDEQLSVLLPEGRFDKRKVPETQADNEIYPEKE